MIGNGGLETISKILAPKMKVGEMKLKPNKELYQQQEGVVYELMKKTILQLCGQTRADKFFRLRKHRLSGFGK